MDTVGERAGQHVFIEMNPRIQVEHTVTEEITDVDLVQARDAHRRRGRPCEDLGLRQDELASAAAALQCRITTEDPANGFRPGLRADHRLPLPRRRRGALDGGTLHRLGGLPVLRLAAGQAHLPRPDVPPAVRRARRALAEFRIRGVRQHPVPACRAGRPGLRGGRRHHDFIDARPQLFGVGDLRDRAPGCCPSWPTSRSTPPAPGRRPAGPSSDTRQPSSGPRSIPTAGPPGGTRSACRSSARRASRSGCASRRRSRHRHDVPRRPPVAVGHPGAHPDMPRSRPPSRAAAAAVLHRGVGRGDVRRRSAVPGRGPLGAAGRAARGAAQHLLQMLLRGRNTVGYTPYPTTSPTRSCTRPPRPAWTSSASSTRSTTSTR